MSKLYNLAVAALFGIAANSKLISDEVATKTLVLLDSWATIETHSVFFEHIHGSVEDGHLGHEVDFFMAKDAPKITFLDKMLYDNIIMMTPSSKEADFPSELKIDDLVNHLKANDPDTEGKAHNLMVFGDIDARKHIRKLANQMGVDFEPTDSQLTDNKKCDQSVWTSEENVIYSKNIYKELKTVAQPVFDLKSSIAFKGIGQSIDPKNKFVFPILRAEPTTASKSVKEGMHLGREALSGEQVTLVSGIQTRSNNRGTVSGSMEMCSDRFIRKSVDGETGAPLDNSVNYDFCKQLINWNFGESGILRTTNLRHNKKGDQRCTGDKCGANPENYKIEDHVEFYIDVEQKMNGKWYPFVSEELPLQFIMLDPYYQVTLEKEGKGSLNSKTAQTYTYKFRTPQRLGIFRFVIDYWHYGLTNLYVEHEVTVIQWRHDAFPRYLNRAFPFYAAVIILVAAFFIFVLSFLFSEIEKTQSKGDKKKNY